MALATLQNIRVAGLASAVPRQIVSNLEYDQVPEEKRQRIVKFTGIQYRRVGPRELCTSDLCEAAAKRLLDDLGWRREEVGAVVFVSQTFDYFFPVTAQSLQARLGLPKECLAFDVNLGCSGYTYGLYILGHLMEAAGIKRGLLLTGDATKSDLMTDPSSAVIFGNGGSATALELSESGKPIYFEAGSDGAGYKVIYIPDGGGRSPFTAESFVKKPVETGGTRDATDIILDGSEIMNFALRELPASVKRLLEFAEQRDVAGMDAFVFHQANLLINTQVARKLGLKPEQTPTSLFDFGNTSSASIPITITTKLRERISAEPMKLVLAGFGIGLSWASAYWEPDRIVCPELVEV